MHESLADAFNEAVKRVLAGVIAGHTVAPNQLRGLFNVASVHRVRQLVEQAKNAGAKVILGEGVKPESNLSVTAQEGVPSASVDPKKEVEGDETVVAESTLPRNSKPAVTNIMQPAVLDHVTPDMGTPLLLT